MRYGSVSMLALTLAATACGKPAPPEPAATEHAPALASPVAAPSLPADATPALATSAPPTAQPDPIVPANPSALGTEPFWNVRIDGATLIYSTPEDQAGRKLPVQRRDTAIGAEFTASLDGQPLILTLAQRTCSDGMSDRAYPLRAVLTIGTRRHTGCAS